MRRLVNFYGDMRISFKLNLLALASLITVAVVFIFLIRLGTKNLSIQAGQERAAEEIAIVQSRFEEARQATMTNAKQLAAVPGLIEAVEVEDIDTIRRIALIGAAQFNIDDVDIVNEDGLRLVTLRERSELLDAGGEAKERLFSLALLGIETAEFMETNDAEQEQELFLAASVPLRDASGAIVGGLLVRDEIDDQFIEEINFGRSSVHLLFLYQGDLIAKYMGSEDSPVDSTQQFLRSQLIDETVVQELAQGRSKSIIGDNLLQSDDEMYISAYTAVSESDSKAVAAILVNMDQFFNSQRQLTTRLTIAAALVGLGVFAVLALVAQQTISRPLGELQEMAQHISEGHYSQRARVSSKDEIGQLSMVFNRMASTVQARTQELRELVQTLEKRVEERTEHLQAAREHAERSDQVKSAFLASMSHELRTPMNAILSLTKFMRQGVFGPVNDEQVDYLTKVIDSGDHLLSLINDVLDVTKIQSGNLSLFVEEGFDVKREIETIAVAAEKMLENKSVELILDIESDLPLLTCDKRRVRQIFYNLISNAIKFTDEGSVTFKVRRQGLDLIFAVIDTGPGIALEEQNIIFDPFIQTETGIKHAGGTGLGLPISRQLAAAHNGRLWVESKPGEGASFFLALPWKTDRTEPLKGLAQAQKAAAS